MGPEVSKPSLLSDRTNAAGVYQYRPAKLVDRELYRAPLGPVGPKRALEGPRGANKYVLYFLGGPGGLLGPLGTFLGCLGSGHILNFFFPTYPPSQTHLL